MSVKRYVIDENALMGGMDMFEDDDGDYVLHSDYAALLTNHSTLKEALGRIAYADMWTLTKDGSDAGEQFQEIANSALEEK